MVAVGVHVTLKPEAWNGTEGRPPATGLLQYKPSSVAPQFEDPTTQQRFEVNTNGRLSVFSKDTIAS